MHLQPYIKALQSTQTLLPWAFFSIFCVCSHGFSVSSFSKQHVLFLIHSIPILKSPATGDFDLEIKIVRCIKC